MNLLKRLKQLNKIKELNSKVILKVYCVGGDVIEGRYISYISELDNEPEEPQIDLKDLKTGGYIGILEHEIQSIEFID